MASKVLPILCVGLFLLAGCASDSPTSPTTDFVSLTSITPAAGTTLTAGARVTFTAVIDCTVVTANGGRCAMIIQDQGNRTLLAEGETQPQADVTKGTTTLTFSHTITAPAGGSTVTVALPVFVNGSNLTAAVVRRDYPVR